MDPASPTPARNPWRWMAAALCVGWIIVILPALPLPYCRQLPRLFGHFPDWRERFLSEGARIGGVIGVLVGEVWMLATGTARDARLGFQFIPLSSRAWLADLLAWGSSLGMLVAAAIPPWALWTLVRIVSRRTSASSRRTLRLHRLVRRTLGSMLANPWGYLILIAIGAIGPSVQAAIDWVLGRSAPLPSIAAVLATAPVAMLAGLLGYGLGLSLLEGRPRTVAEILGGPGRIARFALTTLLVFVGACLTMPLLILPGLLWSVMVGFAPLVVAAEDSGPWRALVRSTELTRGVRLKLLALLVLAVVAVGKLLSVVLRLVPQYESAIVNATLLASAPFGLLLEVACYQELARQAGAGQTVAPPGRQARDPALVVAGGWSVALAGTFVIVVGWRVLHPVPSWLMFPPERRGDGRAPLSEWCPYSFHTRARECEMALADGRAHHVSGFPGARCVPLTEQTGLSLRTDAIVRAADALARAVSRRAMVVRDYSIGADRVDVAVLAGPEDGVILALDVAEGRVDARDEARAGRLAAAGVPEYWRIEIHPNRDPVTSETLGVWRIPLAAAGRYASRSSSSRDPDARLRLTAFPDVRIPADDMLPPPPCHATAKGGGTSCRALAFVVDGTAQAPTLAFADLGTAGVATRVEFVATSAADDRFDPAVSGLAFRVSGPFPGEQVIDAVFPPGGPWRHPDGTPSAWTYRDPDGRVAGITDVTVRRIDGNRLAWDVRGQGGRYPIPPDEIPRWGRLVVHVASAAGPDIEPCGVLFFATVSSSQCTQESAGLLACRGPDEAASCSADDPDGAVRCAVERAAHAEEVLFASRGRHFAGNCEQLVDTELPPGVTCNLVANGTGFEVLARHAQMTYRTGCRWDSGDASMKCS